MSRPLIIRPGAQRDIEATAMYYEAHRVGLGGRFLGEIDLLLERVASNPNQFPEVGDRVRRGLLQRFPYALYFRPEGEALAVIAVLHQHRHPDTWKQRR